MAKAGCLFLTGSTGLIGRAVVGFLKEHRPERSIFALVRRPEQAVLLESQGIHAVVGDLTQPRLGISAREYSELCENLTEILHVAADVRFDLSVEECRPVNVGGVQGILEMARRCGQLRKLGHVSTAYVNGCREGVFAEEPMLPGQQFVNGYQQSKFEAEELVLSATNDLPVSIYRVPIVLADSPEGVVSQFGYFHRLLRILPDSRLPVMPGDPDFLVDMVPADWTAAALAHIFDFQFRLAPFGISVPGVNGSIRLAEIAEITCRTMEQHPSYLHGRSVHAPQLVSIAEFDEFARISTDPALRRSVNLLGRHVRLMGIRQAYLNSKAQADLEGSGLALPEMRSFLTNTLNYCLDSNWGQQPVKTTVHAYAGN